MEASASGACWKKRLSSVVTMGFLFALYATFLQKRSVCFQFPVWPLTSVCGKTPSAINITNAKNLEDVASLLRSISLSHRRRGYMFAAMTVVDFMLACFAARSHKLKTPDLQKNYEKEVARLKEDSKGLMGFSCPVVL